MLAPAHITRSASLHWEPHRCRTAPDCVPARRRARQNALPTLSCLPTPAGLQSQRYSPPPHPLLPPTQTRKTAKSLPLRKRRLQTETYLSFAFGRVIASSAPLSAPVASTPTRLYAARTAPTVNAAPEPAPSSRVVGVTVTLTTSPCFAGLVHGVDKMYGSSRPVNASTQVGPYKATVNPCTSAVRRGGRLGKMPCH